MYGIGRLFEADPCLLAIEGEIGLPRSGYASLGHQGMKAPLPVRDLSGIVATSGARVGELDLLFASIGRGTSRLAASSPGESINLLGPLGRGFRVDPKARNLLLIAGGIGLAPLAALAAEAVRKDLTVTVLAGFRSAAASLPPWLLPPEVEYVVCTEDGSLGRRGLVTELTDEFLGWADQVFACGPGPMLSRLAYNPSLRRMSVQVSLEERMGCAVGACMGCTVRTKSGNKQVCRDGPVFELGDVLWE